MGAGEAVSGAGAGAATGAMAGSVVPGIGTAIGAIGGGLIGMIGGAMTNNANAEEAQKNRNFQEQMSNTAYQRAMQDMRLAGLNPMLAYMQGGASGAQGAQAQMQNTMEDVGAGVTNSAKAMDTERAVIASQLQKTASETVLNSEAAQTEKKKQSNLDAQTKATQVNSAKNAATSPLYEKAGKLGGRVVDVFSNGPEKGSPAYKMWDWAQEKYKNYQNNAKRKPD